MSAGWAYLAAGQYKTRQAKNYHQKLPNCPCSIQNPGRQVGKGGRCLGTTRSMFLSQQPGPCSQQHLTTCPPGLHLAWGKGRLGMSQNAQGPILHLFHNCLGSCLGCPVHNLGRQATHTGTRLAGIQGGKLQGQCLGHAGMGRWVGGGGVGWHLQACYRQ